ncbi:MAG TPA: EAL domain-containing protein [Acidisoma sp.]|uniref:bifunctional diguanylate cyclase/phosphodiesterase n=1 Tax=Acidisoma sp. TaxID=1872115 RepID=UPI002B65DC08|nr:EAL domain-containing protein [Acidisoma sp.]HTI01046.1 EAL domain-containing protein [Acidisoma sp.]
MSAASRRLVLAGIALLIGMIATVSIAMVDTRNHALEAARTETERLAKAIAEQTAVAFRATDIVIAAFRDEIESKTYATPEAQAAGIVTKEFQKELDRQATLLPQADAFTVVDASGHLSNYSRRWPPPHLNLSDRDYFRYFRDHDDRGIFLSKPVTNRGNGLWTAFLARRIDGPSGQFFGIMLGAMDLSYFRNFYREVAQHENLAITLVDRQGRVLASYPYDLPPGQRPKNLTAAWDRALAKPHPSVMTGPGLLDGSARIISVHPLADYPVVVNVSVSASGALAGWRQQAALTALAAVFAMLCMILLFRAIILQLRRLERSEADLARNSNTLSTTLDHISQGIVMIDGQGRVAVCNRQALAMLDLPPGLMASNPSAETVFAYQVAAGEFPDAEEEHRYRGSLYADKPVTYERQRPNGRILEVQCVPLPDGGVVRTYSDVTERRQSEERIRYLAHHDPLTQLANRTLFTARLEEEIARANQGAHRLALLYIDLDRFKYVNDSHGHGAGDALLVKLAERLTLTVGFGPTIARTGGDEFAIILPLDGPQHDASHLARDIVTAVRQPLEIDGNAFRASISIGIAHYPDHAKSASDLLRNADIALYEAKNEGTGLVRAFDAGMEARQQALFRREQDLRSAFELKQFEVVYQPILSTVSGCVAGAEALLRWHHPIHGLVPPADFITLAEKLGLIEPLGFWVLETACKEAAQWSLEIGVAVNLSPVQVNSETLARQVQQILERTGLPPHRLTLEVTEGLLLEPNPTVLSTMHALRALGIRFSLDDFGTGHSGLGYLRRFPFDAIKIDKLFIQDMVEHADAAAIVNALLAVSVELGLEVVAEGVETAAQLEMLRSRQCQYVQGFFLSPPLPAAEMRLFVLEPRPFPSCPDPVLAAEPPAIRL